MLILRIIYCFIINELSIIRKFLINFSSNSHIKLSKNAELLSKKKINLPYKIKNNDIILTEALIEHPGYVFQNLIIANHLRKITGSEILLLINPENKLVKKFIKSFNIKKIQILSECLFFHRLQNLIILFSIFKKIKNIDSFLKFKFKGVFLGKLVYDNILRIHGIGSYDKIDAKIIYVTFKFLNLHKKIEKIQNIKNIKYFFLTEYQFYPSSILFQFFLIQKAICYVKSGVRNYATIARYNNIKFAFQKPLKFSKRLINKLNKHPKRKKFILSGNRLMKHRIDGNASKTDIIDAAHYQNGKFLNRINLCKNLKWESEKKIALILANDLTDGVANSKSPFHDNLSWLIFLLKNIKNQKNINWIIKSHPSDEKKYIEKGTAYYFNKICASFPNIKLCPNNLSPRSLRKIVNYVFTDHGSAGLEYPFSNIETFTSSDSIYQGNGFTTEVKSKYKLKKLILSLHKRKPKIISKKNKEILNLYLDLYIKKTKIKINMPFYEPTNKINHNEFFNELLKIEKKKTLYNHKFHKLLNNQITQNYRHTVDI